MAHYRLKHQRSKKINKRLRLGYIPPQELRNESRARDAAQELQEKEWDRASDLERMLFDPKYDDIFWNDFTYVLTPITWEEVHGKQELKENGDLF
jgi:hypothetical protein